MPTFDHVNLGVPVGVMDTQVAFLVEILGYRRVDPGPEIRARANPMWFEGDDGGQVHLSLDPEHRPAARAHLAVRVGDELEATGKRLVAGGYSCEPITFGGHDRLLTKDPAGNRWELIGPAPLAEQ
jgi:catechol 2,3-dioxygenase-like lactoylglutathione lyase family enzyme